MTLVVNSFDAEGYMKIPELLGDLGLTAQFISTTCPGQTIINGTTSFRIDRVAAYLSNEGDERYFERGLKRGYSLSEAQSLADALLDEVLGIYQPPNVKPRSYQQYLAAAFAVPENRARADAIYQDLLEEMGKLWGTLMAVKGYTRGESFVARNVGLRSVWDRGEWKVKIIFMDHDSIVIPWLRENDFNAPEAIACMTLDETYLWGRPGKLLGTAGHLRNIYRIGDETNLEARVKAGIALRKAYKKTQSELKRNPTLRALFEPIFIERLSDWNGVVKGYLQIPNEADAPPKWAEKQRKLLTEKGYQEHEINEYFHALETNREFLERRSDIF